MSFLIRSSIRSAGPVVKATRVAWVVCTVFALATAPSLALASNLLEIVFTERTDIESSFTDPFQESPEIFTDISTYLGVPNFNAHRTTSTAVGDVNDDGYPDLIDINRLRDEPSAESVVLRLKIPSSGFSAIALGGTLEPEVAELANLDDDGLADLILVDSDLKTVMVFLNKGAAGGYFDLVGAPDFQVSTSSCPTHIAAADLNDDQALDFVVSQIRTPDTSFTVPSEFPELCGIGGSAPGASTETLIFTNRIANPVAGTGAIFEMTELQSDPGNAGSGSADSTTSVFLIDEDGDSNADLLVNVNLGPDTLEVFENTGIDAEGRPTFVSRQLISTAIGSSLFHGFTGAAADLDGDGDIDFVVGGQEQNSSSDGPMFSVYLSDGLSPPTFSFSASDSPEEGSRFVSDIKLADLDHDGGVDIAVAATVVDPFNYLLSPEGQGTIKIFDFDPAAATFSTIFQTSSVEYHPDVLSIEFVDFDLDGGVDLYGAGGRGTPADGSLVPIQADGSLPNQLFENPGLFVHDVDSDGVSDLNDNCPNWANANQMDQNFNGMGDACDWLGVYNPIPSVFNVTFNNVVITGPIHLTSGSGGVFRAVDLEDPHGFGSAIYAWLGNPTVYTYLWRTGGGYTGYPWWVQPSTQGVSATFTLLPGEPERTFYVTLTIIDGGGGFNGAAALTRQIVEVHVTP